MYTETIEYDGKTWHRYPDSPNWQESHYYQRGNIRLHRYVWEQQYGQIPPGYCIHHIDGDTLNNNISNLELVTSSEHAKKHWAEDYENRQEQQRKRIGHAGELSKTWHASEEGHKWHSEHAKEVHQNLQPRQYVCLNCGNVFEKLPLGENKFCTNKCKSAYRRKLGADNVIRRCTYCGREFSVNKYSKTTHCSKSCAKKHRS